METCRHTKNVQLKAQNLEFAVYMHPRMKGMHNNAKRKGTNNIFLILKHLLH